MAMKYFLIKGCSLFFFRHDAITHLIDSSVNMTFGALGNENILLTCFIAILALLGWSGTEQQSL